MKIKVWMSGLRSRVKMLVKDSRTAEERRRADEAERRWSRRIGVVVENGTLYMGMDGIPLVAADDLVQELACAVEEARERAVLHDLEEGGLR